MQGKMLFVLIILTLISSPVLAQWSLQPNSATLSSESSPPYVDVFNDTLKYDDGSISWWFGGLTNFRLATKFTPAAGFHIQRVLLALDSSSTMPVTLYLLNDSAGYPGGAPIWSGNLFYNSPRTWLGMTVDTTNLPQYLFTGGSNFWIEAYSNGPPFEIYDASPVNPARSKTYFAPFGGWFNSPGDNFIRAVGQYTGAIVDAGCDSIWHGGNFFLPNPGTLRIGARVKNFGSAPASFSVACSLFTELGGTSYSFFQALAPQSVVALAPGASVIENFPSLPISTNNRYRIRARTLLAGDGNPDNNVRDTETQIYTPPAELRYDDTLYTNAVYGLANYGWAMKFNPHQAGNYNISQIKVMTLAVAGDSSARVQVLDDNGVNGAPGTILYQTVATMVTGWNAFPVNLTGQTGSFYVAYLFEHGTHTSALRYGDYPASGQGWVKNGAAWAADPTASDWMMRATITTAAPPQLDVTLTPINPPITVPATGGSFSFDASVIRNLGPQAPFTVWARIKNPDGSYTPNTVGPVNINPPVGLMVTRNRTQNVPGSWAAGVYTYLGYANNIFGYPAIDSSSFTFTKLATGSGPYVWDAACTGDPFPGEIALSSQPSALSLCGVKPNPFNPTTAISYQLSVNNRVSFKVYDTAGRLVTTLVDGWQEAGTHRVTFDGSNLSSGVYMYSLTTGGQTVSGKMVLMK